ncbi:peptidase domain-containing protein [Rhizobium phage RHph_TM39]|uniref:Peptidase domain-containing protein n=2 Tax=Cuauhnahuacvirus TaxID=3044696 RepID=A0A7S5R879_9CAUD|nr:peptidase domain-containing protein [Rhizobium phage RHph_TM30]YP_010671496.1 peptidase domain-containing protein [Rhizobium phage RHph_Y65]QIG71818.1 peptidase domain-containing protein [Rhizobium phage RHph_TM40]QIG72179.1 peptidase domain-containing protein [Rhizobium phage RHph_TM2_3B]QIG72542.1 peptidase domain-containing protein [Rhizobium phage RHph_TM3_3_6]QIG77311.1 peptidase domain-containing protein [Rhizobium phage RHph_TM39]QIG77929.1 peptidase domain-containing protein [Rhizo
MKVIDNLADLTKAASDKSHLPIIQVRDLPSKFLPYPKGSTVKYVPFTYGELQKFSSSKLSLRDRFLFVLDGITTEGFDKNDLSYYDFLYVSSLRKISSFSHTKFTSRFRCNSCEESNSQTHELSNIEFSDIQVPALPAVIPVGDDIDLHIMPLSVGNYLKIDFDEDEDEDKGLEIFARSVSNLPYSTAKGIIENATGDLLDMLNYVDKMMYLGRQSIETKCSHCGADNHLAMEDINDLIFPFRQSAESVRNVVRFGILPER